MCNHPEKSVKITVTVSPAGPTHTEKTQSPEQLHVKMEKFLHVTVFYIFTFTYQ